jgi:hypothetical protein
VAAQIGVGGGIVALMFWVEYVLMVLGVGRVEVEYA